MRVRAGLLGRAVRGVGGDGGRGWVRRRLLGARAVLGRRGWEQQLRVCGGVGRGRMLVAGRDVWDVPGRLGLRRAGTGSVRGGPVRVLGGTVGGAVRGVQGRRVWRGMRWGRVRVLGSRAVLGSRGAADVRVRWWMDWGGVLRAAGEGVRG